MLTPSQISQLSAPLSRDNVKQRDQSGRKVSYVEGWHVIAEANRIFGFGGWTRETVDLRCVNERERKIGQRGDPGWAVTYIARVRVLVEDVVREGCGAGHGIDRDLGQAHESALKEAETDAMKRALMTFGNPFGLALYDKEQAHVADETSEADVAKDEFIANARLHIQNETDPDKLKAWWQSAEQSQARRDAKLGQEDVEPLKQLVMDQMGRLTKPKRSAA